MDFTAQIRFATTGELVMTGTSDGKGSPSYEFEPGVAEITVEFFTYLLREAYDLGIYSKGSIGEVRDMLNAMNKAVKEDPYYVMRVPRSTSDKAEKEAEAFIKSLPDGAVF